MNHCKSSNVRALWTRSLSCICPCEHLLLNTNFIRFVAHRGNDLFNKFNQVQLYLNFKILAPATSYFTKFHTFTFEFGLIGKQRILYISLWNYYYCDWLGCPVCVTIDNRKLVTIKTHIENIYCPVRNALISLPATSSSYRTYGNWKSNTPPFFLHLTNMLLRIFPTTQSQIYIQVTILAWFLVIYVCASLTP